MKTPQALRRHLLRHNVFLIVVCFLCVISMASSAFSQSLPQNEIVNLDQATSERVNNNSSKTRLSNGALMKKVSRPDEELLIFKLMMGREILNEVILTYEDLDTEKYYVPLEDMLMAFEFPIEVNQQKGTAEGWFLNDERTFKLDLSKGIAIVNGNEMVLDKIDIENHEDGIYVTLDLLQKWFPVTLDVDFSELAIVLTSLEPLPFEIRAARDQGRDNLGYKVEKETPPLFEGPNPMFTIPVVDINTDTRMERTEEEGSSWQTSYSALFNGIVGYQDVEMSLNDTWDDDDDPDVRLRVGRRSPNNDLISPLGLSEYQFGDVSAKSAPIIASNKTGLGVSLTNRPFGSALDGLSNTITLRGELPVGYQADLKRNGELLSFIDGPNDDGEYVFEEVIVYPGLNTFEIVLYGPQGQTEVKEERIYIGNSNLNEGDFHYDAAITKDLENLFSTRRIEDEDAGENRFSFQGQYGLTGNTSLYGAISSYSLAQNRQDYILLGSNFSYGTVRYNVGGAISSESGKALTARAQGVHLGYRWQVLHNYYDDMLTEKTEQLIIQEAVEHETEVNIAGMVPFVPSLQLPFSLEVKRYQDTQSNERIEWSGRVTKNFDSLRTTTQLNQVLETDQETDTTLNLQLSSRIGADINLRGTATYSIDPEDQLESIGLTGDYSLDDKQNVRLGLTRSGGDEPVHGISGGYSRDLGFADLGTSVSYNDEKDLTASFNMSFSLAYDEAMGARMRSESFTGTGGIKAHVFLDNNNNDIFDEGDEPLSGVKFGGMKLDEGIETDEDGYAVIPHIEAYSRAPITLQATSLKDPFIDAGVDPLNFYIRPSQFAEKTYALKRYGELDGMVYLFKYAKKKEASSINVQVLNSKGEVAAENRTEFDGFLLIQKVPIEDVTVRVDPEQLEKLGYCPVDEQQISLPKEEPFATLEDFVLYPQPGQDPDLLWLKLADHITKEQSIQLANEINDILSISFNEGVDSEFHFPLSIGVEKVNLFHSALPIGDDLEENNVVRGIETSDVIKDIEAQLLDVELPEPEPSIFNDYVTQENEIGIESCLVSLYEPATLYDRVQNHSGSELVEEIQAYFSNVKMKSSGYNCYLNDALYIETHFICEPSIVNEPTISENQTSFTADMAQRLTKEYQEKQAKAQALEHLARETKIKSLTDTKTVMDGKARYDMIYGPFYQEDADKICDALSGFGITCQITNNVTCDDFITFPELSKNDDYY